MRADNGMLRLVRNCCAGCPSRAAWETNPTAGHKDDERCAPRSCCRACASCPRRGHRAAGLDSRTPARWRGPRRVASATRLERRKPMKTDLYNKVTDEIVLSLEQGVRPSMKPGSAEHAAGRITRPLRANGSDKSSVILRAAATHRGRCCSLTTHRKARSSIRVASARGCRWSSWSACGDASSPWLSKSCR